MDTAVAAAITAVHLPDGAQQDQWFELICQTYDQLAESGQVEWRQFAESLATRAEGLDPTLVEQFTEYLDNNDPAPAETVGRMRELADSLPQLYQELAAGSAGDGYDEAAWQSFLAENGTRWNGDEASWEQFKQWFLYEAEQQGLAIPANQFVIYVESQSDKVATFGQYGVTISPADSGAEAEPQLADVSAYPDIQDGDTGEWVEYLDTMLKSKGF